MRQSVLRGRRQLGGIDARAVRVRGRAAPACGQLSPSAFLDYDETSMIVGSREEPTQVLDRREPVLRAAAHKYYLSVRGGKDTARVSYKITAMRVAAHPAQRHRQRLALRQPRCLHYFWGCRRRRWRACTRCARRQARRLLHAVRALRQPIGTNLERVSVDGHGVASPPSRRASARSSPPAGTTCRSRGSQLCGNARSPMSSRSAT